MASTWVLVAIIALFWSVIHYYKSQSTIRLDNPEQNTATITTLNVSGLTLHINTTTLNNLPRQIVFFFKKLATCITRNDDHQTTTTTTRSWSTFWDAGTILVLAAILVSQAVLISSTIFAINSALQLVLSAHVEHAVPKRSPSPPPLAIRQLLPSPTTTTPVTGGLILRPVIPGITAPLSSLPLLVLTLFAAQSFHELGHAIAAVCDNIPVLSTGIHVWIVVASFYVSVPSSLTSPLAELRVASAGVWNNLVLVAVAWFLSEHGGEMSRTLASPWFREVLGGVQVISVDPKSPLASLILPQSVITHLNDLDLATSGTPALAWVTSLSSRPSNLLVDPHQNKGWCLPREDFNEEPTACCVFPPPTPTPEQSRRDNSTNVCLTTSPLSTSSSSSSASLVKPSHPVPPHLLLTQCRDFSTLLALPDDDDEDPLRRCVDERDCARDGGGGFVCARPEERERVLRIEVRDLVGVEEGKGESKRGRGRVVVWQGKLEGVLRQVEITDVVPKLSLIPVWLPSSVERFYSLLYSLSLALAFFNLLPLPYLDGRAIFGALIRCLTEGSSSRSGTGAGTGPRTVQGQGEGETDRSERDREREREREEELALLEMGQEASHGDMRGEEGEGDCALLSDFIVRLSAFADRWRWDREGMQAWKRRLERWNLVLVAVLVGCTFVVEVFGSSS
ncbi:hypothetical protein T439DRAFT_200255 [Meredithblackwellia eburnea MCA 4105]